MTLHIIPIEPMEERYSAQWLKWFSNFQYQNPSIEINIDDYEPYHYLSTNKSVKIINGEFLDVLITSCYKAQQLSIICQNFKNGKIKNNDTLLFLDGWFPGMETIAYIRDGLKLDIKIIGMFHAGTYDDADFLSQRHMGYWARELENSWFKIYDKILVATEYHRNLIIDHRKVDSEKIEVVFFPMILDWNVIRPKDTLKIVFPHRIAPEKNPHFFTELKKQYSDKSQYQFLTTHDKEYTKNQYWGQLASSEIAVSFAAQETWGIAMIESVLSWCIPIVPDRCSYTELYPDIFKYESSYDLQKEVKEVKLKINEIQQYGKTHYLEHLDKLRNEFIVYGATAIPQIIKTCLT